MKMRKILILLLLAVSFYSLKAEIPPRAIGLRAGGGGYINSVEASYQHRITTNNRIELDLGFGANRDYSALSLAGMYQWDYNITEGLNWFAGPGIALGMASFDYNPYFNIGIGGQIGLEYNFNHLDVPILASLDFRPLWIFGDNMFGWGIALGVRYTF